MKKEDKKLVVDAQSGIKCCPDDVVTWDSLISAIGITALTVLVFSVTIAISYDQGVKSLENKLQNQRQLISDMCQIRNQEIIPDYGDCIKKYSP